MSETPKAEQSESSEEIPQPDTRETLTGEEKARITAEYLRDLRSEIEDGRMMPLDVFLGVIGVTPVVSIECSMLRTNPETNKTEVLMTRRAPDDPVWPNQWHSPGTVLRPFEVNEGTKQHAFNRIFSGELDGIEPQGEPRFTGEPYMYGNERSSEVVMAHYVEVSGETPNAQFFPIDELPEDTIEHQLRFIQDTAQAYEAQKHGS